MNSPKIIAVILVILAFVCVPTVKADAPAWMHNVVNAPLPPHDEKTDAVNLYSEIIFSVQGDGKIKRIERQVYRILRPAGRSYGTVYASFDAESRINSIHGWCIPAQGKDFEVKDKDALETSLFGVQNGELVSDLRTKVLIIPAADPGNVIGYEIEHQVRPYVMQDIWDFQQQFVPVREAHYKLLLPSNWEFKAAWLNHGEVKSSEAGASQHEWVISDIEAIRPEEAMPPFESIAGAMVVSIFPPGGGTGGFRDWADMGRWQEGLNKGRTDASPEIKQKVAELTRTGATDVAKMRALAQFVQRDVRYVAIQLGIGGWQPHLASEIFTHRYGDCKDKAALMNAMLKEVGVESYFIGINTTRGTVSPNTPATRWFNHVILAVRLPASANDPSLVALLDNSKLGRLLIFDPTDEWTPFGQLRGELQANYGLLVSHGGGELVKLPQLDQSLNGVNRTARLVLTAAGTLSGDFVEERRGDFATFQRSSMKSVTQTADRIKPIEKSVSRSLATFQITKASISNLDIYELPLGYQYSLTAPGYAKTAGDLLLVRPRVMGSDALALLETKEPRKYAAEFEGPAKNTDRFEIILPAGYEVDDLPPPVDVDYGFASYHSKTEATGNVLKYTRTFEITELSVPLAKTGDLKKFYRIIAGDERNTAVLKPVAH
jgi:hypothetical protein